MTLSTLRLNLLRATYLFIGVGLAITVWPGILSPKSGPATEGTVIASLLGGLCLVSCLGLRHPAAMLPILVFELAWKTIWIAAFALPAWMSGQMDAYTDEVFFACALGVVLVGFVLPWHYVWHHYILGRPIVASTARSGRQ